MHLPPDNAGAGSHGESKAGHLLAYQLSEGASEHVPIQDGLLEELQAKMAEWEAQGQVDRRYLSECLRSLEPFDIAELLDKLPQAQGQALFSELPIKLAADVLADVEPDTAYYLIKNTPADRIPQVLKQVPGDVITDIVGAIHPRRAEVLLGLMPEEMASQVKDLLKYPPDTAGGRMTIDHIAVRESWTIDQVLAHVRKVGRQVESIPYVYIVDERNRLLGTTTLQDLILSNPQQLVKDVMDEVRVKIQADSDQEEAARLLTDYGIRAVPVVDQSDRLLGMITVDDIIDVIEEETTEDITRLGGSEPLEGGYFSASFSSLFRKRVGWLFLLFIAQSLTGSILKGRSHLLEQVVALSFFIPLLIDTGGNAGGQAATLVIRAMAIGEVTIKDFLWVVFREVRLGLALGAVMAMGTVAQVLLLGGSGKLGLTVAFAIVSIVTLSSSLGGALPMIGRRLGLDPAVFSAPMVTTIVDTTGLILYFAIASLILGLT